MWHGLCFIVSAMKYILLSSIMVVLASCIFSAPAHGLDRRTVPTLDLNRFLGHWYEIARFDHRFERHLEAVETDYKRLPDGKIEVLNRGIDSRTGKVETARGKAHTTDEAGRLRVSFFWFFYSDYNILEIDADYEWALIGSRSPKYLWILARQPHLDQATLDYILRLAQQRGYPTGELIFVRQPAAGHATEQQIPRASI